MALWTPALEPAAKDRVASRRFSLSDLYRRGGAPGPLFNPGSAASSGQISPRMHLEEAARGAVELEHHGAQLWVAGIFLDLEQLFQVSFPRRRSA